jgi:hypothetical protein
MLEKVFVPLAKLAVHPKSPHSFFRSGQQNRPTAFRQNLDRMAMFGRSESECSRHHNFVAVGGTIHINASNNKRPVPPRMIVKMTRIVRTDPVMDSDREQTEVKHPSPDVRAFGLSEIFRPTNETHKSKVRDSNRQPPASRRARYPNLRRQILVTVLQHHIAIRRLPFVTNSTLPTGALPIELPLVFLQSAPPLFSDEAFQP